MRPPRICLGQDGFVTNPVEKRHTRDEILRFAEREGFAGIELHSAFEIYTPGSEETVKRHYAGYRLEVPGLQTAHITSVYSPVGDDPEERAQYVRSMRAAIAFAGEMGAVHATLTPPTFDTRQAADDYLKTLDVYTETVHEVVADAEKHAVVMAVEPEPDLVLNGGNFRDAVEDVKQLLTQVSSKNLAVLYDFAHVNMLSKGDPVGFLKELGGRVSWVHVADNDMRLTPQGTATHLGFGEGNVEMKPLFAALKAECPDIAWLQIDTWENPDPYGVAARNRKMLASILQEISWS